MGHFCSVPGGQEAGRTWWELLPLPAPKALVWFIEFLRNSPPSPCAPTQAAPIVPRQSWESSSSSSSSLTGALGKQGLVSPSPSLHPANPTSPTSLPVRPAKTPAPTPCRVGEERGWVQKQSGSLLLRSPRSKGPDPHRGKHQNLCTSASRSLRCISSL